MEFEGTEKSQWEEVDVCKYELSYRVGKRFLLSRGTSFVFGSDWMKIRKMSVALIS